MQTFDITRRKWKKKRIIRIINFNSAIALHTCIQYLKRVFSFFHVHEGIKIFFFLHIFNSYYNNNKSKNNNRNNGTLQKIKNI